MTETPEKPQIEKVCPLFNAGMAASGKPMAGQTFANRCRKDCQWYVKGKCAVFLIPAELARK